MSFKEYFYGAFLESYIPRKHDLFFHGSVGDFDEIEPDRNGLVYVTRNVDHAMGYASSTDFGGSYKNGFLYVYTIKPDSKIFDSTEGENFREIFKRPFNSRFGYSEIIQQPDIVRKILQFGYDGILQKQAKLDHYNNIQPELVKRYAFDRDEGKIKYYTPIPIVDDKSPFYGTQILGIKPDKLEFIKKIAYNDIPIDNTRNILRYIKQSFHP